jgi:hypothetical protein
MSAAIGTWPTDTFRGVLYRVGGVEGAERLAILDGAPVLP